jgi:hypothetical protein
MADGHAVMDPRLCVDVVRLLKRRDRHGLHSRCEAQGKGSNSYQPDHCFLPFECIKGVILSSFDLSVVDLCQRLDGKCLW